MKGILFKPDMIKAIREGKKTQTRRLSGLKEINQNPDAWIYKGPYTSKDGRISVHYFEVPETTTCSLFIKPRYQVGEVVYIKEAWRVMAVDDTEAPCELSRENRCLVQYKLGNTPSATDLIMGKWRSPMFMPAWAARYFLQITGVRAEKLQNITEADAIAEGMTGRLYQEATDSLLACAKDVFAWYWDRLNPRYPWSMNPFVFVYSLMEVERP